jgi:hypothetical protein
MHGRNNTEIPLTTNITPPLAAGHTMHDERRRTNKCSAICNLKVNYEFNLV